MYKCTVQLTEDPSIRREGLELVSTVKLPYLKAILGGKVRVPTLDGETDLPIPPGQRHFSALNPACLLGNTQRIGAGLAECVDTGWVSQRKSQTVTCATAEPVAHQSVLPSAARPSTIHVCRHTARGDAGAAKCWHGEASRKWREKREGSASL